MTINSKVILTKNYFNTLTNIYPMVCNTLDSLANLPSTLGWNATVTINEILTNWCWCMENRCRKPSGRTIFPSLWCITPRTLLSSYSSNVLIIKRSPSSPKYLAQLSKCSWTLWTSSPAAVFTAAIWTIGTKSPMPIRHIFSSAPSFKTLISVAMHPAPSQPAKEDIQQPTPLSDWLPKTMSPTKTQRRPSPEPSICAWQIFLPAFLHRWLLQQKWMPCRLMGCYNRWKQTTTSWISNIMSWCSRWLCLLQLHSKLQWVASITPPPLKSICPLPYNKPMACNSIREIADTVSKVTADIGQHSRCPRLFIRGNHMVPFVGTSMVWYIPAWIQPVTQQQNPCYLNMTKVWENHNICFFFGFDVEDWHTVATCPQKKVSHQDGFNYSNHVDYKHPDH